MRLAISEHLVNDILKRMHESDLCADGDLEKMCYHLRSLWFPSLRRKKRDFCHSCFDCLRTKGMNTKHIVLHTRKPAELVDTVFIDVVGPLPNDTSSYDTDHRYILTMMNI